MAHSLRIRRSDERGHAEHGWLKSFHTFSFADYFDRDHMGFRALRVINEDWIQPANGFGTHPHRDMEIVTYVLEGELQHRDSMGNGSVIRAGDVQYMSAGSGVTHSEENPSPQRTCHLLQIWILPDRAGYEPRYGQKNFPDAEKRGRLRLVVSPDGADGSIAIRQDVKLYAAKLDAGAPLTAEAAAGRGGWIQVAQGALELNGEKFQAGDAAAFLPFSAATPLQFVAGSAGAEFLYFDLA